MSPDFAAAREHMIEEHLRRRKITDERVLEAFRRVPREAFVPGDLVASAYEEAPLPIGEGQTISQPYVVALTVSALALNGGERVLEVGAGSGYAAAILSLLARDVYAIERIPSLADSARERLASLGFANVVVVCADGSLGLPEHAPYDAIAVSAGAPHAPEALLSQLTIGGRLVIPIGKDQSSQMLVRITRESKTRYREEDLTDVRFVPLLGAQRGTRRKQAWREISTRLPEETPDGERTSGGGVRSRRSTRA